MVTKHTTALILFSKTVRLVSPLITFSCTINNYGLQGSLYNNLCLDETEVGDVICIEYYNVTYTHNKNAYKILCQQYKLFSTGELFKSLWSYRIENLT